MLWVGRELEIRTRGIVCQECSWRGAGAELSTGLVRINSTAMYFYAYRCPECLSFDLAKPARLLQFKRRSSTANEEEQALHPNHNKRRPDHNRPKNEEFENLNRNRNTP